MPAYNNNVVLQLFSRVRLCATPWMQHARLPCPLSSAGVCSNSMSVELVMPSNHLILLLPSPLAFSLSQHQGIFQWVDPLHQVAKVLELQLQHQSLQWVFRTDFLYDWLVWSCSPSDSQESSLATQFKGINSLALSLFHCPALTSEHDY